MVHIAVLPTGEWCELREGDRVARITMNDEQYAMLLEHEPTPEQMLALVAKVELFNLEAFKTCAH